MEFIEPKYDPKIHLVNLDKELEKLNITMKDTDGYLSKLAYTSAFKLLSDEGLYVLKNIIKQNLSNAKSFGVGSRVPMSLRNLGYSSQFIRDFTECPVLLNFLSKCAGKKLKTHTYLSSYSHCNIGIIGSNVPVDQWHCDSVPFVLVILMSDMTGAEGGTLQVIKKPRSQAFKLIKETNNNIDPKDLLDVEYPGQGYAIFMQGSHFAHHVTPVKNAKEPRITMVNSYMPEDILIPDETRLSVFKNEEQAHREYFQHKLWILTERLKIFMNNKINFTPVYYSTVINEIISELKYIQDVIIGDIDDKHDTSSDLPYYVEKECRSKL